MGIICRTFVNIAISTSLPLQMRIAHVEWLPLQHLFDTATSLPLQHFSLALQLHYHWSTSLALQLHFHCNTSWTSKHIVTTTSLPLQLPTFTGCVWLRCRSNFIAHCYFKQTHICRKLFTKENKHSHATVQVDPKSDDLYVTHAIQWGKEHGDTLYLSKAATTTSTKYTTTSTTTFPSCAAPPRLIGQNFKA